MSLDALGGAASSLLSGDALPSPERDKPAALLALQVRMRVLRLARLSRRSQWARSPVTVMTETVSFEVKPTLTGKLVLLNVLDEFNRSCGFRIALAARANFGRGFGTEATRLVLGHAFDTVGLHRVELEVYRFNPRARHVYEKVGFVHEGTKRQALCWDGEWIDADLMAMLASEWRHE